MTAAIRIVTVTYNSEAVIGRLLASIPAEVEVVVVDNASRDGTRALIGASQAKLIASETNLGFGAACNLGREGFQGDFIFFVNPDAVLDDGCCDALLDAARSHPEAGAINPAIRNENGAIRLKRRSTLVEKSKWTDRSLAAEDTSAEVAILSGAALFCRVEAFDAVGGFDPRIFLYHEDDDICRKMREAGWTLRLEHGAGVRHIGSGSTGYSSASVALKAHAIAQSRLYVEGKYGKPFPRLMGYLRAIGKIISPLSLLSARKRTQALAYLRGISSYRDADYGRGRLS